jgi:hypothetical protein
VGPALHNLIRPIHHSVEEYVAQPGLLQLSFRATVVILLPNWVSDQNSYIAASLAAASGAPPSTSADASQAQGIAFPAPGDAPGAAAPSAAQLVSADTSAGFHFMTASVSKILSELRQGNRKLTSLRCPDFLEYVTRHDPDQAAANSGAQSAELKSELSLSSLGSGRTADGGSADGTNGARASTSTPAPVDASYESWLLNHACLLTLCVRMQLLLTPECARLEKALRGVVFADETGGALTGEAGNATGAAGTGGTSAGGNGVAQGASATGGANAAVSAR